MDVGIFSYSQGDPLLIDKIVNEFLSQGKFDKLRKECMSDADTKPAYQNLQQRVETTVTQFLKKQIWKPDVNKNQLRDSLKKHVLESNFFDAGINRIVDQVVNPNVLATVFLPEVEEVVYNYLSIPKPPDKAQKKGSNITEAEKLKPPGNENGNKFMQYKEKKIENNKSKEVSQKIKNEINEISHLKDISFQIKKESLKEGGSLEEYSNENIIKTNERLRLQNVKIEDKISVEVKDIKMGGEQIKNISLPTYRNVEKLEFTHPEESQESRLTVESLQISETKLVWPPDSGDSYALEINEKSMSESRDSEDSIMNQMSPISQGRLTPDIFEGDNNIDENKEKQQNEEKKALTFIGRIPKLKREDSESSKSSLKKEVLKTEKSDSKVIYSSDESDSNKSCEKSDYEERNSKDRKSFEDKRCNSNKTSKKRDFEMKIKDGERLKTSKSSKSVSSNDKEKKKDKNESKSHKIIKSFPSYSRERDHHKNPHATSQHKYSEFKESLHDKKKKEQKKKNKNSDDHEKEKNKKNDRRSTDRDSNERDKYSGSRIQSDSRKKEREQKTEENKGEKSHKEEAEMENEIQNIQESDEVVLEMEEEWVPEEGEIVLVNEEWICSKIYEETESEVQLNNKIKINQKSRSKSPEHIIEEEDDESLNFEELIQTGELALIKFSEPSNDFYVKFNSTGFKYFEEWEKCKLDCEEEFKEFVDEAENNLTLISDDDSEFEDLNFDQKNQSIIDNLLKGVSNYKKGLMFNPFTSEFYKWTNSKYYYKFRKKFEKKHWKNSQKNESDESIKENINQTNKQSQTFVFSREKSKESHIKDEKFLHLKLLNRYKRKALRQGRHRRKYKRKIVSESAKEKKLNSNDSTIATIKNGFLFKSDVEGRSEAQNSFLEFTQSNLMDGSVKKKDKLNFNFSTIQSLPETTDSNFICLIEKEKKIPLENTVLLNNSSPDTKKFINNFGHYDGEMLRFDENGQDRGGDDGKIKAISLNGKESFKTLESQKKKKGIIRLKPAKRKLYNQICQHKEINLTNTILPQKCDLPLSPESDDCSPERNGAAETDNKSKKSIKFENGGHGEAARKRSKRNNCQKYENQDLYKPRLILKSSRTRGRKDQGLGNNTLCLNSLISISNGEK